MLVLLSTCVKECDILDGLLSISVFFHSFYYNNNNTNNMYINK